MPRTDADAATHLIAAMRAASSKDAEAAPAALDAAERCLTSGPHQSRAVIAAAQAALSGGDWMGVWSNAYQAICLLTWAWPPDLGLCPPPPTDTPLLPACPGCQTAAPPGARFCYRCGTPLSSPPGGAGHPAGRPS
jgi:hypothetical protein